MSATLKLQFLAHETHQITMVIMADMQSRSMITCLTWVCEGDIPPNVSSVQAHAALKCPSLCSTFNAICPAPEAHMSSSGRLGFVACYALKLKHNLRAASSLRILLQALRALRDLLQFVQTLTHLVDSGAYDPKMNALESVVVQHFQGQAPNTEHMGVLGPTAAAAASSVAGAKPGRVIVFTNYRESVNSVLEMFQKHEPLITAR